MLIAIVSVRIVVLEGVPVVEMVLPSVLAVAVVAHRSGRHSSLRDSSQSDDSGEYEAHQTEDHGFAAQDREGFEGDRQQYRFYQQKSQ